MKEEILTAKEWLEKEGLLTEELRDKKWYVVESGIMEKYANYKNKVLEDRIKEFREMLKTASFSESSEGQEAEYWLEVYDKHFNIQNK